MVNTDLSNNNNSSGCEVINILSENSDNKNNADNEEKLSSEIIKTIE